MAKIRDIAARYSPSAEGAVAVSGGASRLDRALEWFGYSETYARSAECLSRQGHEQFLPWQQLAGRALECAVRGCLESVGFNTQAPQDLVSLFEQAESLGFYLREGDLVMIVLVSHGYPEPKTSTPFVPVNPRQFGVITQYSHPPSLKLNRALRDLRRQALLRLGTSEAEA
ncbi:hypothetical protein [Lysobacter sp. A3-1-A15]|uniref:hypothetical protein n=1 Tax=Novilysobacter viscosus TaxID=3098602 RepID=UPI002EDA99E2